MIALGLSLCAADGAMAHHSFAMFETTRQERVEGVVASWQWVNPHAWLNVTVIDPKTKKPVLWEFEGGALQGLRSAGFGRDSFKAGQKVQVQFWPRRNGDVGGAFTSVKTADGTCIASGASTQLCKGEPAPTGLTGRGGGD